LIFLSATLLIAIARPYKETYMNVFDILLLGQLTFMSKMLTEDYYDGMGTQLFIANLMPVFTLMFCLLYGKVFKRYKLRCTYCTRRERNNHEIFHNDSDHNNSVLENMDRERNETQPLLNSVSDRDSADNNVNHYPRNYESID
jgi:hypothetical protein